ncbi:MAG TPA: signal peptidase I [Candidatus Saccharimonadia bacterium]|nr:signal peptidase I [Candidatus Saccharimonadia bacterium]
MDPNNKNTIANKPPDNQPVVMSDKPLVNPVPPTDDSPRAKQTNPLNPVVVHYAPEKGKISEKAKILREGFNWLSASIKAAIVIVLFILILVYVITPIQVDGISMQPTLHTGNIMLVFKWPQTWARLTGTQYVPSRTNIVIIAKNAVSGEELIKRVIALPGERVVIANQNLTVYNSSNPNGFNPDNAPCCRGLLKPVGTFSTTVPDGQVFAMGDNRQPGASIDSRSSIGNISSKEIIGKVVMRIYPFNKIKFF